jgi:signal transduction histidine kinase
VLRANAADRAKTDFLARASHDLRAPLTSIIGYAQLLQGCGGTAGQHGQIIRHSADHMLTLINDLVEYASGSLRDEIDARPQRLPEFIERLAHEATMLARRNHNRFVLQRRDGLPGVVWMDARRVQQIVGNLIENAAKFTRQGSIELTVGHSTDGAPAGGVMLQIEVRDTGCGISADDLPRVFEPFFRCGDSRRIEGTGLGLPIVDLWIKRMGGSLQLDSTPASAPGSASPFRSSSAATGHRRPPADEEALPARFGGGRRLWVVEDAAETRGQLVDILENAGFVVACAEDGQAFIERIGAAGRRPPASC